MKKFISIFLMSVLCLSINAQWFSVGAKIGYDATLSSSKQYSDILNVTNNLKNGFHVGAFMRLGRRIYAQPEVVYNYAAYNSSLNFAGIEGPTVVKYKNHTIDVPVLLGYSIINSSLFKIRVMIGPKFSFDVGSTKPFDIVDTDNIESFTESIRKSRVGLDCGFGLDLWRITIDVRYNLLPNIYKVKNSNDKLVNGNLQNTFQVTAGFRFFGQNSNR